MLIILLNSFWEVSEDSFANIQSILSYCKAENLKRFMWSIELLLLETLDKLKSHFSTFLYSTYNVYFQTIFVQNMLVFKMKNQRPALILGEIVTLNEWGVLQKRRKK